MSGMGFLSNTEHQSKQANKAANLEAYYLRELAQARDTSDRRHYLPPIKEGQFVLDVGCGIGLAVPGSTIIGIDVDTIGMNVGRRNGMRNEFVQASGEFLPFRSESFDMITARVSLPYMRIQIALKEMYRVLKPKQTVWLALHGIDKTFETAVRSIRRGNPKGTLRQAYVLLNGAIFHFTGKQYYMPFTDKMETFQTEAAMRRELEAAGFHDVNIVRKPRYIATARKR
jgi:ubiquinone/menaquinone biosynthesis C-methylase UbiE